MHTAYCAYQSGYLQKENSYSPDDWSFPGNIENILKRKFPLLHRPPRHVSEQRGWTSATGACCAYDEGMCWLNLAGCSGYMSQD